MIETAGTGDQVLNFPAPLTMAGEDLEQGLGIIEDATRVVAEKPEEPLAGAA